jgi:hypothetical protein
MEILMNRTLRFLVFTALLSIFTGGYAWASDGKVITIRNGNMEIWKGDKWEKIGQGSSVSLGDRVRTDKTAVAVIKLSEIGSFTLGPDTEMEVGKDKKEFKANLNRGSAWLNSKLPKGSKAYISTSLATAGIRGTKFSVIMDEKGMDICTCTGEVDVILKDGKTLQAPTGKFVSLKGEEATPDNAQSSLLILKRVGEGKNKRYDFCFDCHIVGGRGEIKRNLDY